jgi:hypothetical protein
MRKIFSALLLATLVTAPALFSTPALSEIRKERVQFQPGKLSKTIQGTIKGDQIVDYLINAKAGQSMTVSLTTNNGGNSFNIFAPGKVPGNDAALFIGETNGNRYKGTLPASGDYLIRVALVRSAARRNEVANYKLQINIAGNTSGGDAKVPGTNYNATGNIPCSMGNGQPTGSCPFGVTRKGNGTADVTVKKPDGRSRIIFFEKGKAIGYDVSQADPGKFSASKEGDLTIVRIGKERYEIPDAVIFGG